MERRKPSGERQPVSPPAEVVEALGYIASRHRTEDDNWRADALCSAPTVDPAIFDEANRLVDRAQKFCESCPVATQCLEYATTTGEAWLIYGGLTAEKRRAAKRRRGLAYYE